LIDYLTLLLTHSLIALALWRLLFRPELDADDAHARPPRRAWHKDEEAAGEGGDA
jgi:hypothetical protein